MDADSDFDFEGPANPSSTEDNEEGGSAIYINGVAVMPACCRHYAHIGRMCGHCPKCPFAVLVPDSDEDENDSRQRRAAHGQGARVSALAPPPTPPSPVKAARKGPPRRAKAPR